MLIPMHMEISVSPPVRNIYDFVETLPEGSVIWMGFDYYNTTRTECDAQAISFLRHAFRRNLKVFVTSVIPDGNAISMEVVNRVAKEYNKEYGKDYAILGYKPGAGVVILNVCNNLRSIYNTDINGTNIDDIPLMTRIRNAKDVNMIFTATDNASFDQYVQIASTQYHIPMAGGSTAVSVPHLYVYINAKQVLGVLGGLKGAAEYEELIGHNDTATVGMNAQSFVHLFITLMIIFSNIVYFVNKYRKKSEE